MKFEEYKATPKTAVHPEGVISLTKGGWFFGRHKPDFEFARILFNRESGVVKFEPIDTREHVGIGYMRTDHRRGHTTYTLKNVKFVESGIAPLGKYRAVEGEERTYQFYMPSRQAVTKARDYSRSTRKAKAKKEGKEVISLRVQ